MKEIISFRQSIPVNTSLVLTERIKDRGVIENIMMRFYPGVESALRIRPVLMHDGKKPEDFFTFAGTKNYIDGSDDTFNFPVSMWVDYDDELYLYVTNTDNLFPYSLVCDFTVSYDEEVGAP